MSHATASARKLVTSSFESIRKKLLERRFRDRLSKPLAYWALPNERPLPLIFLNRSVGELINTPFEELLATPGVGQKKISTLVKILQRATVEQPTVPFGLNALTEKKGSSHRLDQGVDYLDSCFVSDALWSEWTGAVRAHDLGDELLGRVAASLAPMPTMMWTKTLRDYESLSLSEIRSLRTHGEKRVRCLIQVFHRVYAIIQQFHKHGTDRIRLELGSQRILSASKWIESQLPKTNPPKPAAIRQHLAEPVLQQIEVDCGHTIHRLAKQRVGFDGKEMRVREQAKLMGVTRARVYQLLDDCHKVLQVRWPDGRYLLDRMTAIYGANLGTDPIDASLFLAVRQLCFPDRNDDPRSEFADSTGLVTESQPS